MLLHLQFCIPSKPTLLHAHFSQFLFTKPQSMIACFCWLQKPTNTSNTQTWKGTQLWILAKHIHLFECEVKQLKPCYLLILNLNKSLIHFQTKNVVKLRVYFHDEYNSLSELPSTHKMIYISISKLWNGRPNNQVFHQSIIPLHKLQDETIPSLFYSS